MIETETKKIQHFHRHPPPITCSTDTMIVFRVWCCYYYCCCCWRKRKREIFRSSQKPDRYSISYANAAARSMNWLNLIKPQYHHLWYFMFSYRMKMEPRITLMKKWVTVKTPTGDTAISWRLWSGWAQLIWCYRLAREEHIFNTINFSCIFFLFFFGE